MNSQMSLWGAVMGHANLILHSAGWMEGGLVASFEKMVVDAEMIQGMTEFMRPLEVNDDTLAVDAIKEVGPGGHFFGSPHTMERYETAFYAPMVSDWRNFETWRLAGAVEAAAARQRDLEAAAGGIHAAADRSRRSTRRSRNSSPSARPKAAFRDIS